MVLQLTNICFFPVLVPATRPVFRGQTATCALNFARSYFRGLSRVPLSSMIDLPQAQRTDDSVKLWISESLSACIKTSRRSFVVVFFSRLSSMACLARFLRDLADGEFLIEDPGSTLLSFQ